MALHAQAMTYTMAPTLFLAVSSAFFVQATSNALSSVRLPTMSRKTLATSLSKTSKSAR